MKGLECFCAPKVRSRELWMKERSCDPLTRVLSKKELIYFLWLLFDFNLVLRLAKVPHEMVEFLVEDNDTDP